jgi:8-hydroxy-5-deazaflavin:NADPH oxidoreductase
MSSISILGSGNMARGIASRALAGGNSVQILDREPDKSAALANELSGQVTSGRIGDPLSGEIVVLAVPYPAAAPLVTQYGQQLDDKIIIDITNPVDFATFDGLVTPTDSSAAEEIAKAAPAGASVVKAFNTTFAGTLVTGRVAGQPLDVLIAGDNEDAKTAVARLVEAGGLRPVNAGPLRRARQLEHAGFLHMALQQPLGTGFASALRFPS